MNFEIMQFFFQTLKVKLIIFEILFLFNIIFQIKELNE
jgi:hypothetical protein